MQRILIAVGIITSFLLIAAAAGLTWGLQRFKEIQFAHIPSVEEAPPGEPSNWLLVGSDSREGIDPDDPNAAIFVGEEVIGKRTDTIMVARVNPEAKTIDLVSVPRDLWVTLAGTGEKGRVNSAFNGDDGPQRLVSTVENSLDIEINHYAEINFVGFQKIIDAIGGVPIWFETPVRDPASALDIPTSGCHMLDGFDSLAFARSRHLEYQEDGEWKSDTTGDLGRTARQQYLLSRLADTASSRLDLTNPGTVDKVLRSGAENLVVDNGNGAGDLIELARTFASVGGEGISRHALPVTDFETSGGAQVLDLNESEAQPILDIFRGLGPEAAPTFPSEETVPRNSFTVDVNNAAQIEGLAGESGDELRSLGFDVGEIGNATPVDKTIVFYPSDQAAAASVLGRTLIVPPRFSVDDTLDSVMLVLGSDYEGLNDGTTPTTTAPPVDETAPPEAIPGDEQVGVIPGPGPEGTPCA